MAVDPIGMYTRTHDKQKPPQKEKGKKERVENSYPAKCSD
jgi:hypothetical protein